MIIAGQFAKGRLRTGAWRAFLRHRTVGFQGLHDERLRRAAPAQPGCSCQLATPLPRAIRSGATRRVGGAHAPATQACYGIGRQGCNTLVYVRARLEGDPTLRLLRLGRPRHHRREHVGRREKIARELNYLPRGILIETQVLASKGPGPRRKCACVILNPRRYVETVPTR